MNEEADKADKADKVDKAENNKYIYNIYHWWIKEAHKNDAKLPKESTVANS
jgi:hypothetical protein